jgi:hypothetical protein
MARFYYGQLDYITQLNYLDNLATLQKGDPGPTGPANTLTIGTVTTGTAAATITGNAPSQTLNLTLPTAAPNSLAIGTVTTGANGAPAAATITGSAPNQTLNLTLPKGDQGIQGNTGPANTLTIGTVTTGTAAATITGSAPNQTLNLTLPTAAPNTLAIGTVSSGATAAATITGSAPNQTLNLTLPKGANWKGAWVSGTTYAVDDWVTNAGSTYRRKVAGAGATVPGSDSTNWDVAAAKGADGAGTVSSVNSISPVSGNVTLAAADVGALPAAGGSLSGKLAVGGTLTPDVQLGLVSGSDTTNSNGGVAFYGSTSNKQAAILSYNTGSFNGDLRFFVSQKASASLATTAEAMRLNPRGALIGTTTDDGSSALQIGGAVRTTSTLTARAGTDGESSFGADANGSIELGKQGRAAAGTPFIDFHSSTNNTDHDVRLVASGGTATAGQGTLSMLAKWVLVGTGTDDGSGATLQVAGSVRTTSQVWVNGASSIAGYASAMTLYYTGEGSQHGFTLKPATSVADTNAINFMNSAGTVAIGQIQHLAGNAGMNLTGSWKYQGSPILTLASQDTSAGYVGLTSYKINFKNAANTFTSFLTNTNTAARTYTFPDKDGTVAMTSDLASAGAMVLLGQATVSSAVAQIDFLNIFTSAYDKYVIEVHGLTLAVSATPILYPATGGVAESTGGCYSYNAAGTNQYTNLAYAPISETTIGSGNTLSVTIEVRNANDSVNKKQIGVRGATNFYDGVWREGTYAKSAAMSGFRLATAGGGNITAGTIRVYGIKNS